MEGWAGVVLAAGKGTRMKSRVPKVLHRVCGQELVRYPVEALRQVGLSPIVLVVSPQNEESLKGLLGDGVEYVQQARPLGTGHALRQVAPLLKGRVENLLILGADAPLIRAATLQRLVALHLDTDASITLLTSTACPSQEMGRVVRNARGQVAAIVEEDEAKEKQRGISEVNGGAYCCKAPWLWENLERLTMGAKGEFYLTALIGLAASQGARIEALLSQEPWEVLGINDRVQLAQVEAVMRQRIREHWMWQGVTILDPATTFIDATVELGQDTLIYPNTMLLGRTRIGQECQVGPNTVIQDSTLGGRCKVTASVLEGATLEERAEVGPFSHLRPGAHLEAEVHVGNFSEVKNSRLGRGTRMGHFGYVGDAAIGAEVNIGAGTVTCNFDGVKKNETVVEEGAFIGSDTMLVAPLRVGARAATGAGAVVTRDVPADSLVVGVPAKIKRRKKVPRS